MIDHHLAYFFSDVSYFKYSSCVNRLGRRSFKKYTIARKSKEGGGDSKQSRKAKKWETENKQPQDHQLGQAITTDISKEKQQQHQPQPSFEDECCKKKVGYLVKSPSKLCFRNKIARWHLRWFVLYDNQPRCDAAVDSAEEERVVELLYYKNHREEQLNAQPLGEKICFYFRLSYVGISK